MRKSRRPSRAARQNLTVILLLSLIGYMILPPSTSASKPTGAPEGGVSANKNRPPQKEKKYGRKDDCPTCSPAGNQELYMPLADLPESKGGELVFNSRSPKEMQVTPTFYKLNGTAVVGDPVNIRAAEIRYVDFKKLLPPGYRGDRDWGGLSLSYYGVAREMWAQFRLLGVNGRGNVDEFFIVKDEPRSDVQEAAWWTPRKSSAVVALGNVTDGPTAATLTFGDGETQTVSLAPHGTEIVRHRHRGGDGVESVKIDITGAPGSIIPTGLIESDDGSFNSVIRFYDTKSAKQPNLYANGLRMGGVTLHMVLKNTGASPVTAQPKFITSGGMASDGEVSLPDVVLAPGETKDVSLSPLSGAARGRQDMDVLSVRVANSGKAGSLIGAFYGINQKTGVSYDTPLRDSGPVRAMTGSYPWKVTKDYTTVVYITNITDEQAEFVGEINYSGNHFLIDARKLAPGETARIDLREVQDKQEENKEGQRMSKEFSQGQFKWAARGDTKGKIVLIGRAEMVSLSQNISTSYSCNDPCPPSYEGSIDPFSPPVVFVSATGGSAAWETVCYSWGTCYGPYSVGASWSLDTSVGTLSPTSGSSTTMTGTTAGDATLDGFIGIQSAYSYDGRDCYYNYSYNEGGQSPVQVVTVSLTATGVQEVGKPTHFLSLKGSGNATVTATLDPSTADPGLVSWTGGSAGSDNLHRNVSLSTAADTNVSATVEGHTETVRIHVIDAATPPAAAVDITKTKSSGGSVSPGSDFGLTVVTIGTSGVVRPTYHVDAYFSSDKWVFRLKDLSHSYKQGTNSQGRINLPNGNPASFPLAPGMNLTQSHTEARDDFDTTGLSGTGPRRRSYWVASITQDHEDAHVDHFYSTSFWLHHMDLFESDDVEASTVSVTFDCTDSTTTTASAAITKKTSGWDTAITTRHNAADAAEISTSETFAHGVSNPKYVPIRNAIPVP